MAWQGSTRRSRLPPNWAHLRNTVRSRAGGRCEHRDTNGNRCPNPGTDCDHINRGDDHQLSNLQWLCDPHHKAKTAREAIAARADRPSRRRPPETHPGLHHTA